ncbi:rho guanine nucleotide exchange factor 1b isoform X4 [Brienomyrus brachyistius]|uniref:rho guanine nucleotide exchange factor 1b isoform X4 n=1 Tax=Brienomyrus brachyistius TaxID=42636 RepID=UPI0020B1E60E|nr:rho guanine nucleotide exchange factor 1b isoform X4 [Brienomyrus brachyistius]
MKKSKKRCESEIGFQTSCALKLNVQIERKSASQKTKKGKWRILNCEMRGLVGSQSSKDAMSIIGAEDEDFETDLESAVDDHCSHFSSLDLVKTRPTHLLVFLQHVMLQFDCAPLLCYLHADLFRTYNAKETKKQFSDFYNTFLDKGAVLRVSIPSHIAFELDRSRPELLGDETQRRFALDIQNNISSEVVKQLDDFRTKRMMGMTPYEHELIEVENHRATERIPLEMKEKAMAETLLDKMFDIQPTISTDEEKFSAIFSAVTSLMKHLGVKAKATDNKKSRSFFWKIPGRKPDETKSKQRFPSILSDPARWIGGGNEIKTKLDNEVDKEKFNQERKGSSAQFSRPVAPDPIPAKRPSTAGIGGVRESRDGPENPDTPGVSISVITSPDPPNTDPGVTSNRLDPPSVSEGGEVSPVGTVVSPPIWEPAPAPDPLPEDTQDKDRMSGRLARSESLCVERRRSHRGSSTRGKQSRSRSDVDLQAASSLACPPSPSQPHFPPSGDLGTASSDSLILTPLPQEEVEPRLLELEQDPPNWRDQVPGGIFKELSKKEIKRQEVINELFTTEHAHVRMLSVLQTVFFRPLERREIMTLPELSTIFPNLDDIFEMHYAFYENLKKLRQEDNFIIKTLSSTLLNRFHGSEGEWFQKLTARFCSHQSYALDVIKSRQKKDPSFGSFIQEAEAKPQCRRLQLKDIIPMEMQRLTKYPLLLGSIAKSTADPVEKERIEQAEECCRRILNHVNEVVKDMENLLTLKDYQRRLDTSGLKPSTELYQEYKNLDLTSRRMNFEGPVTWKVTKEKSVDVQCVLLGDLLVLLQRQDEKMVLKCHSKTQSGVPESKQMLSPVIKLSSALLREVATDPKAFYMITCEGGAQIYELVANSAVERKNWTAVIQSVVKELKMNGGSTLEKPKLSSLPPTIAGVPYSPTTLHPQLTLTENGSGPRSISSDPDKFEAKVGDTRQALIDYLSANGFELLSHSNAPQEKVASGAFEDVAVLEQLLVGGTAPKASQPEEESREDLEADGSQSAAEGDSTNRKSTVEQGGKKEGGPDGEGQPIVLSQDQVTEMLRCLHSLELHLKQLQAVEEEHHRLQDILCKFSISAESYQ